MKTRMPTGLNPPRRWPLILCGVLIVAMAVAAKFAADLVARVELDLVAARAEAAELRAAVDIMYTAPCVARLTKKRVDEETAKEVCEYTLRRAPKKGQDPRLIIGVAEVESGHAQLALSEEAAWGWMGIHLATWARRVSCNVVADWKCNIDTGIDILAAYRERFARLDHALTAYNRGEGRMAGLLARGEPWDNGYAPQVLRVKRELEAL